MEFLLNKYKLYLSYRPKKHENHTSEQWHIQYSFIVNIHVPVWEFSLSAPGFYNEQILTMYMYVVLFYVWDQMFLLVSCIDAF